MNITQHKWFNALMVLMLMLGTLGITGVAAKCDPAKNANCPTEAPGQQVETTESSTDTQVETVSSEPAKKPDAPKPAPAGWTNTNSNAAWKNVVDNAVTNPSGETRVVTADDISVGDVGSGVEVTDAGLVILPGVGNADNNGQHSGGSNNPNVVPLDDLLNFLAQVGFNCGEGASNANVACWNHFPPSNLWKINGSNGSPFAMPVCFDTGNANNPLAKDYGGFLIKASHWYHQVYDEPNGNHQYPRMFIGETHTCS